MSTRPKALLVDDRRENLLVLERLLGQLDIDIVSTTSSQKALSLALEYDFFVAIVDVQMPEMDGYELVEQVRSRPRTANLPVLFVSAIYSDEYHHRKGYDAGAVDFLSKPFIPEILISKVKVFLDLYNQRARLEDLVVQLDDANQTLSKYTLQLETGVQVARQVTSILELDTLLSEVVRLTQEQFDYYFVGIWLMTPNEESARLMSAQGKSPHYSLDLGTVLNVDLQQSLIAHTLRTGNPYLCPDVHNDPRYMPIGSLPDTASELVLPLKFGDKLLGVLDIQSEQVGAFEPEDATVLQSIADQVAIALRNAQLYAEVITFNTALEDKVRARTAELEKAYQYLELLDRNKSDFIEVVAHELRTPLTLVKGFSQLLSQEECAQNNPLCLQQVNGIVLGAARMHEIVNSMLDMLRIDSRTLELVTEPMNLQELLQSFQQELIPTLHERRLTLEIKDLSALPAIEADPDALSKVFNHLLFNAIKYTPDGGHIFVAGRFIATQGDDRTQGFVQITVSDSGIGIAPEAQELIFTKFYRTGEVAFHSSGKTKFKGGGPGLGLAIARGIVEAHGGKIWAESPGYDEATCPGSQFHTLLPVKQGLTSPEAVQKYLEHLRSSETQAPVLPDIAL